MQCFVVHVFDTFFQNHFFQMTQVIVWFSMTIFRISYLKSRSKVNSIPVFLFGSCNLTRGKNFSLIVSLELVIIAEDSLKLVRS